MANPYYSEDSGSYRPINLRALQIGVESGGNQFDPKTGKPLTSNKGAVGIAQVMPDTAPEAARLAGLPWDENRYKNDRDYNLQLGDAYQGHLDKVFGKGSVAATAAYNAGPTKVAALQKKYGDSWASYLPPDTKRYVKDIMGVDISSSRAQSFSDGLMKDLGLTDYTVADPKPNETQTETGNFPIATPGSDAPAIKQNLDRYQQATSRYADFLQNALPQLHANSAAIADKATTIAATKRSIFNDFSSREADLESKIKPLMDRKQAIVDRLSELDAMSPLERRLKSAFNSDYDPRVLRGRLDRVDQQIKTHEESYSDLNTLRSGVAALSVDADTADTNALSAQSQTVLADGQLLGQVAGAVHTNLDASALPGQMQVQQLQLTESAKHTLLGNMTVERTTQLYNQAQASPDGSVTVDGLKFTTGELQDAARSGQAADLSFRSMVAARKANDLSVAQEQESYFIDHMTPEQINEALKNGGQFQGQQLSITKLTGALAGAQAQREANVTAVVENSTVGFAASTLKNLSINMKGVSARAKDMFGNLPGELSSYANTAMAGIKQWQDGFEQAKARGVEKTYLATTMPQVTALQKGLDDAVTEVAKKWGGGRTELQTVAESYLKGNPLSGDAAIHGLMIIAKSGMPAGSKLTGPALQALQVAQATIKEYAGPNAKGGASLEEIMAGNAKMKPEELTALVQDRVTAAYTNGLTDQLINALPSLAQHIKDPSNPSRPHPFAAVNRDDFISAIRFGDNEGYTKLGQELGITPQQAQSLIANGVNNNPIWEQVKKDKGYDDGKFAELFQALQGLQMAGTLTALDASHSARPGFSPAKAFISLLSTPEASNQIDALVNSYGRSSFGAFLVSSAGSSGYRDAWQTYGQAMQATYTQLHSTTLRQRITQQRSLMGNPDTRMNAVLRAANLTPQESSALINAVKPLVSLNTMTSSQALATGGLAGTLMENRDVGNFDQYTNIIRNHKFDDPALERIRKKAASQWDAMDAVVGRIGDSMSE